MTEPTITAATAARVRPDVHAAIARAAQATGTDFSYLLAQARIESGLNPAARAATSSAAGLYQFTGSTWLATLARHGDEHGLGWAQQAAQSGDPALRAQVLALRLDPQASAAMAAELAGDNADALRGVLGRDPDSSELYLAHFLGADGASRFLSGLAAAPDQSAAALLPKAAAANRAIFYDGDQPRSLGQVMAVLRGKVEGAMGFEAFPLSPAGRGWGSEAQPSMNASAEPPSAEGDGWHRRAFPSGEGLSDRPLRPSMADTLAATFGGPTNVPAHVRTAYNQLKAFGL
ncbi:MAG: transglycosylase SLT domain-containing protein [Novosphingobium sp.]